MTTPPPTAIAGTPQSSDDLAAQAPWPLETLLALPGQTRGVQLQNWAREIGGRYGTNAVRDLRASLGAPLAAVGDAPDRAAWVPLGLPLALHQALVDQQLGGDWRALQDPMREDALAQVPTLARWSLRAAGLTRLLDRAPKLHSWLYDCGSAELQGRPPGLTTANAGAATIWVHGGGLFLSPHWCLEQVFALETLGEICGLHVDGITTIDDSNPTMLRTELRIRWRPAG